jgi:hypothetical protein
MFSGGHVREGDIPRIPGQENNDLFDFLTSIMTIKNIPEYISSCNTEKINRNVEFFN